MPSGYVYSWTGKVSSSFGLAGNWYNQSLAATATAAPGTSDEALVVAGGTIEGPGSVFELGLTGTGSGLDIESTLVGSYVFVAGTVNLDAGAQLGSNNLIDIGDGSSETIAEKIPTLITVEAGATLYAASTETNALDILIGQQGGNGTLAVTGANAVATSGLAGIWAGDDGLGVISVSAGGQIYGGGETGQVPGAIGVALGTGSGTGSMTVTGAGSEAAFGNIVEVGYGGTGVLTVSDGATLIAGDLQDSLNIGDTSSSASGAVSISGATADLYGVIEDGAYGQGALSLSNGANVVASSNATSGTASEWSVLIGAASGGNGTLSISSQAVLTTSHGLAVGSVGNGTLIASGGTLVIEQQAGAGLTALAIGLGSATTGVVDVTGGLIDDRNSAGVIVGGYGAGTLAITSSGSIGGVVETGNPAGIGLTIGSTNGSSGSVTVSGINSALKVDGTVLDGSGGSGSIALSAGALFTAGAASTLTGLAIGGAGGPGSFTLGTGAVASVLGQTSVGDAGSGTMTASGGSDFTGTASGDAALVIGVETGISGKVLITDAGTTVNLGGGLTIGSDGNGALTLENAAQLTVTNSSGEVAPGIVIAAGAGSTGTLTLESGASMSAATGITVGSQGTGLLTVSSATLSIATSSGQGLSALNAGLAAGTSGTIDIIGGLVEDTDLAGVVLGASGTATLSITASGSIGGSLITGDPSGAAGLALAVGTGSSASVSVSGKGSILKVDGTVSDASAGKGTITIDSGAHFSAGFAATATGLAIGGTGGTGSFILATGSRVTVLGQTDVGEYGSGSLIIAGGSVFTDQASGFEALVLASGTASSATALVTGGSTSVLLTGGLEVGAFGDAQATITGGATVTATTTSGNGFPSVVIAQGGGSSTLRVTGAGTRLAATGQFEVGGTLTTGSGTLLISSGATVTVAQAKGESIAAATIGGVPGRAASAATVTGKGSAWTIGGQLAIGGSGGAADLVIADGGHVTAGSILVDTLGHGSQGKVSVAGAGSKLSVGALTLGSSSGTGSLAVGSGAMVEASGAVSVHGAISLGRGTLTTTGTLTVASGSAVSGSGLLSAGAIVDLGQIGVAFGELTAAGKIIGSGTLLVSGGGTLLLDTSEAKGVGINFGAGGGALGATSISDIAGTITGWSAGDYIGLISQDAVSDSYSNGTLTLFGSNSTTLGALHFAGNLSSANFTLSHITGVETVIGYSS